MGVHAPNTIKRLTDNVQQTGVTSAVHVHSQYILCPSGWRAEKTMVWEVTQTPDSSPPPVSGQREVK